jgi:hypothetical protein
MMDGYYLIELLSISDIDLKSSSWLVGTCFGG